MKRFKDFGKKREDKEVDIIMEDEEKKMKERIIKKGVGVKKE